MQGINISMLKHWMLISDGLNITMVRLCANELPQVETKGSLQVYV